MENPYVHTNAKGQTYYLHERMVKLRGGRDQKIYFFAKQVKAGAIAAVPEGMTVWENPNTGLPLLKKI